MSNQHNVQNPFVQHFYLRNLTAGKYTKAGVPIPKEFNGPPVGVIAFQFIPGSRVRVAGSMVSRKDAFVKKTGVAKAHGRLLDVAASLEMPVADFKTHTAASIASMLGLYASGNHFCSINWVQADNTKSFAMQSLEARVEVPAST